MLCIPSEEIGQDTRIDGMMRNRRERRGRKEDASDSLRSQRPLRLSMQGWDDRIERVVLQDQILFIL